MRPHLKHGLFFAIFILIFLFPYLRLVPRMAFAPMDLEYVCSNYVNSFLQSLMSTLLSLVFGLFGALGLFWLEGRVRASRFALLEFVVLLPALLPALFLVVPVLNLISFFPFGFTGVVLFHALAEVGIVALALKRIFAQRLTAYADTARMSGSSAFFLLRKTASLWRVDVLNLALILIIYFLTSFSIPLLIGGSSLASLEISVFESLVVHHNWPLAMNLFIFQCVSIGILLLALSFFKTPVAEEPEKMRLSVLENPLGIFPLFLPPLFILIGWLTQLPKGLHHLSLQPQVLHRWQHYFMGSLTLGFLTAGCVFVFLSLASYFLQFKEFRRFFVSFFTPSFVILGFSFFLLPGLSLLALETKIAWALTIAFVPTLLRFGLLQKVLSLEAQLEMASFLGGGSFYIFKKITWPQCLPLVSMLSGLAGVWAVGDFSLSRVIAGRDVNLAMWVQSLVDQYRWDMALVLSALILVAALMVFGFFWGLSYVARQKLI